MTLPLLTRGVLLAVCRRGLTPRLGTFLTGDREKSPHAGCFPHPSHRLSRFDGSFH